MLYVVMYCPFPPAASLEMLTNLEDTVSHIAQGLHKDSIKVSPASEATTSFWTWVCSMACTHHFGSFSSPLHILTIIYRTKSLIAFTV